MEGDEAMVDEAVASLGVLAARAEEDKIKALLAGEADGNDCYIEVHAGAGGTESQDWAEVLQRMYMRSEEHTSELQSLMRHSYPVFCLKKKHKLKIAHSLSTRKRKL